MKSEDDGRTWSKTKFNKDDDTISDSDYAIVVGIAPSSQDEDVVYVACETSGVEIHQRV